MRLKDDDQRLGFIDGLRALAVLAVVVYHMSPEVLPGGFVGVDVFLVISGFVVSRSIVGYGGVEGWAWMFFARRVRRLLPALFVCLIVTSIACALWVPEAWLSDRNPKTARMAFIGLSNWLMVDRGDDYFSPAVEFNPYAHTWSLGLEEQFYLLFPVAVFGWIKGGSWPSVSTVICLVAMTVSLTVGVTTGPDEFRSAFHLLPARAWEFLAGALIWRHSQARMFVKMLPGFRELLASAGLVVMIITFFTAQPESFPMPGAVLPVLSTSVVLLSLSTMARGPAESVLALWPLRAVGRISYSLYLWHWPVLSLFRWTVGLDAPGHRLAAACLFVALAWLSWRYVEQVTARGTREWSHRRVLLSGGLVMLAGATLSGGIHAKAHKWSQSVVMQNATDWFPGTKARGAPVCGVLGKRNEQLGLGWVKHITLDDCARQKGGPRVFAIGDSHALALGPMFASYSATTGADVYLYNNGGCAVASLQPEREASEHCIVSFRNAMLHMEGRLQQGDVVLLPSLRMARRVDQWGGLLSQREIMPAGIEEAKALLSRFRERGAEVVLLAPNILLDVPLFRCADAWTVTQAICQKSPSVERIAFESRRQPMLNALKQLARDDPGITIFDPLPVLCGEASVCHGYRGGRPLFFDADHLSAYGSELLAPAFITSLRYQRPSP